MWMPRKFNGERILFSTNCMETTGCPHVKNQFGSLPHTECRNRHKMDQNLNAKATVKRISEEI